MGAKISPCCRYRYTLTRRWGEGFTQVFCMLNPSTADAELDDPTIRRCIGFAKREGAGGLHVVNLFAFRATDPTDIPDHITAFGPENYEALAEAGAISAMTGKPIILGWGNHGGRYGADKTAIEIFRSAGAPMAFFTWTKEGQPKHPLYVKGDTVLEMLR
ncbi:DUF1643 domain-containing protein [Sphingomonas daechungensis]|uniref:DUF1643 domain-containing protein n=1 Tax=Sphingomonas daechungensis TaxID=1176646 RepID=UPI0037852904